MRLFLITLLFFGWSLCRASKRREEAFKERKRNSKGKTIRPITNDPYMASKEADRKRRELDDERFRALQTMIENAKDDPLARSELVDMLF